MLATTDQQVSCEDLATGRLRGSWGFCTSNRSNVPVAQSRPLTFWFLLFGLVLVMPPKGDHPLFPGPLGIDQMLFEYSQRISACLFFAGRLLVVEGQRKAHHPSPPSVPSIGGGVDVFGRTRGPFQWPISCYLLFEYH